MRKLKKALSLVLAIALVLGLCTIGAAAIEPPNGEYEGGLTIEYHVTANDLSRLLAVEGYGANAEVDDLRLIFKDDLTPGIDSLDLIWNEASDSYGSVAYSNYMDVQPNCIKSLAIKLSDGRNLEVSESDLTANYIGTGSHIYELSLTEADETYLVTFWAQQGDALHWTRYSVVAVEKGGTVGDKMPADPDTGNYVFIGWELGSHDGSGSKFTADTVVNADIDVYARKVSVGGGSAYHVMNPDTELNAYAAAELGAASAEAVTIDSVRVNGQDEEATNPSYITNGWEEHNGVSYFYIYNDDAYAASFDPQYNNTRVPANEVTSITLFCTLNGEQKEVNIGIDELELAVVSDVIVEIRLHKSGDGDFIITASAGENGSISPVGNVSVAAGADQLFSFLPSDGFTVDTLTVNNTTYENNGSGSFDLTGYTFSNVQANGSIHVTFAADANDDDIPDYKEPKYDVTYQFVSGTVGKELPESGVPVPPSDSTTYLTGITVTNKGTTTYKPVSADDGTWTFTGWDATQKEMVEGGITFTGTWTFTPNEPEPTKYAVNYHIVDANGKAIENKTVYLTEDEFEGYEIWQPDGQAGCTFSGWFPKVSDLEANHAQVTKLNTAKKWELYGRFTPNVPTDTWLQSNVKIQVDCQTLSESVHKNMDTKLIAGSYSSGSLHANADGSWGYSFTVYVDSYLEKYNETYGEHTANDSAKTVNLTFRNGEWQNSDAENNIYAVFDVKCVVPTAPTAEQAAEFFKVKLDCLTSNNWGDYQHSSKQYGTTAESVTVGTVVYENGAWTCPVTIDSASYVAAYSEEFGEHTNSGSATQVKKLVYEGGSWKRVGDDVVAFDVKCAEPEIPTVDDIVDMFSGKGAVKVECITEGIEHNSEGYELVAEGLTIGNPEKRDNKLVLPITIKIDPYLKQYEDVYGDHTGEGTTKTTYKVFWNGTAWTFDKEKLPLVVFDVKCDTPAAPKAPTEDELKVLFDGKVFVDCVAKSWHPTYGYGLLANGYTVAGPVKGADGEYTCTVTLLASAYLAEYNGDVAEKHALASYQGDEAVELKWTGSAWTVINGELPVTFDVVCDTWYPPIIPPVTPSEPVYTPNWLNTTDHVSYIIGYSDGTVKPNAGITRAEVATIFFRLLTDGARERFWSETNAYSDVAAGSWYNIAVSTLSNMGILGGYEDGTFRPNASITRAEFAKIAVSFFDWADIEAVNSFVDVRGSAWYADYVAVAAELGLIEGYGGNVFRPDATITRAEACTIINRTLGRNPDADHLLPVGRMNTWPDNADTGVWYYAQIQEATNSHDYRWIGDIEQWTAKLADPDWDKLQY